MRESDFCIPTSNRAVISITPSWYDRRALDTHANYALYSSLSHLAHLAQSSPKVRESLACDGGLERLTRILKEGKVKRTPERFQASKWQQALLCVVNVGVRGSESVRNRVVESGVVAVLVTILCNALENIVVSHRQATSASRYRAPHTIPRITHAGEPHITSLPTQQSVHHEQEPVRNDLERSPTTPAELLAATALADIHDGRPRSSSQGLQPHDERRRSQTGTIMAEHRPRHLHRTSINPSMSSSPLREVEPIVRSHSESPAPYIDSDINDSDSVVSTGEELVAPISTLSISSPAVQNDVPEPMPSAFESDLTPRLRAQTITTTASVPLAPLHRDTDYENSASYDRIPASWDQDVIWSLRLLAYLSKYPYLRPEFSRSHDEPGLRQNLKFFDALHTTSDRSSLGLYEPMDEDLSDTLRLPFNIFQLVEKFTMRIHADESTYWAGVIMRNSCRRHNTKGGVRQCAYLECGKWEEKNKQFAKCRRCRRTKYCSKACQSKAWKGHRYWCQQLGDRVDKGDTQE